MSCYVIATIKIKDRREYELYEERFEETLSASRGRLLIVDEEPEVYEGEWPYTRTVVLRFHGEEEARQWYDSDGYRSIIGHRHRAADSNIVLVRNR